MHPDSSVPNKLDRNARVVVPAMMIPSFRSSLAIQDGVERNLLFRTWGGLGDQVCAEPTLRYALGHFKGNISIEAENPELFSHLKFHEIFDLKKCRALHENYLVLETITPPNDTNLVWQFFSHMLVNCVDFPSMCAYRMALPIADKEICLPRYGISELSLPSVAVHPGRHWPSKTFPKDWWDAVLARLIARGITPAIIGANTDDNRGTVDVDTTGCVDLRGKHSLTQTIGYLQACSVLLTNDSAPLHIAASGDAWIGFVATAKHPDYITHWRKGEWGWRMQNLGKGGLWDLIDLCPNKDEEVTCEFVEDAVLRSWLPDPVEAADWAVERAK